MRGGGKGERRKGKGNKIFLGKPKLWIAPTIGYHCVPFRKGKEKEEEKEKGEKEREMRKEKGKKERTKKGKRKGEGCFRVAPSMQGFLSPKFPSLCIIHPFPFLFSFLLSPAIGWHCPRWLRHLFSSEKILSPKPFC